jgi:hypothetical protein
MLQCTSVLTRKFVSSSGWVAPMGGPRRADRQGQLTHLNQTGKHKIATLRWRPGMEPRRYREHGGGGRRQDPPGLKGRVYVN